MSDTVHLCKRCNRPISGEISIGRGYGYRCWRIHRKELKNPPPPSDRITILEEEIKHLKEEVRVLQTSTVAPVSVPRLNELAQPNIMNGSPKPRRPKAIPVLQGGWDMGELNEHPLFLEQKKKCENL